ncbi:MAG: CoA pyrophosphatase [Pseudomonadota bacterium]
MITLDTIAARLRAHEPERHTPGPRTRQAAVAIILCGSGAGGRDAERDIQVGFIQRAMRDGDPWSAQMAFPGGHRDPEDADLKAAAVRETREEIGVDLSVADYYGSIDQTHAMPRGRNIDMIVEPHVFQLPQVPDSTPNYEVAEVVWAPLGDLMGNRWHDTETRPMNGTPTTFNGYRLPRGHFVWGLTYRMLKGFFTLIDPDWPLPPEL